MRYRYELPSPSTSGSLIGRAVAAVGAAVLLVGAFFLGFIVLAVVVGIAAIAALVLWARLWWFSRKLQRHAADLRGQPRPEPGRQGETVEGEFVVIREERTTRRR